MPARGRHIEPVHGSVVGGLGFCQWLDSKFLAKEAPQPPVLPADLRARARSAVDLDQHGMSLFPKRIQPNQSMSDETCALELVPRHEGQGDVREGILVEVGESLPFAGKAFMWQTLRQVAAVHGHCLLAHRRAQTRKPLEPDGVEIDRQLGPKADTFVVGIEDGFRIRAGVAEP